MDLDQRELRNAFGCFATGITVITTTDGDGAHYGVTANSFTSVSLDPPLVLFCLDNKSMSFDAFRGGRHFVVNILGEEQQAVSGRFARSDADKWDGMTFDVWDTGCPVLPGCMATMECDTRAVHEGGDHIIVVGQVRRLVYDRDGTRPLIYYRGRYEAISPEAP